VAPDTLLRAVGIISGTLAGFVALLRAAGPRSAAELRHEATTRGIGEKTLHTARKREGIPAHKERIPHGRWIWGFSDPCDEREDERERTRDDGELPGP
jgi:hypothetical protein